MPDIALTASPAQLNTGGSNGLKSLILINTGSTNAWVSQRSNLTAGGSLAGALLVPGQNLTVDNVAANLKSPWWGISAASGQITVEELY